MTIPFLKSGLTRQELFEIGQKVAYLREKVKDQVSVFSFTPFFRRDNNTRKKINFRPFLGDWLEPMIDPDGGMIFCCDIYRKCNQKPLVQKEGFEKSLRINLNAMQEIKKQRLYDILNNPDIIGTCDYCDYCDRYVEEAFKRAREIEKSIL